MAVSLLGILGGIAGLQGVIQGLLYTYPPYITGRTRQTYRDRPNVLPSVDQLISMRYRGEIESHEFYAPMKELGYEDAWADSMYNAAKRMLDGEAYVRLWRRGELTEDELDTDLAGLHFNEADSNKLKKVTEFFPQPMDLIRFAVREVYNDQIRSQFGMDDDISNTYLTEAAKAGLPEEQARNFWAAHWELPSPNQGFEMLHRNVIDKDELGNLLKALDIMPFWRDKLTKIAYSPYTRVDVRRMYGLGVLGEDELLQAYKDIGYDDEHAENMVKFTKLYEQDGQRGITRGSVTRAYKQGLISKEDLIEYLTSLGYSDEVVDFWMTVSDFEKAESIEDDRRSVLFEQYRTGAITQDDLRKQLGYGGFAADYQDIQMQKAESVKAEKMKLPSKTDLGDWLVAGIIPEEYYSDMMKRIGYRQEEIGYYLAEYTIKQVEVGKEEIDIEHYQRWLGKDILSEQQFRRYAEWKGYTDSEIEELIIGARSHAG